MHSLNKLKYAEVKRINPKAAKLPIFESKSKLNYTTFD